MHLSICRVTRCSLIFRGADSPSMPNQIYATTPPAANVTPPTHRLLRHLAKHRITSIHLCERRTSIFGLTSMSFVSNFGRQIFTVFLAAQRYLRDLASKRYFRTNCIHSIRLRTTIKAGIFPFNFSIFFRETTLLESKKNTNS